MPLIPIAIMLNAFRDRHPMGSITTNLLQVVDGIFVVKAEVVVNNTVLGTGIAGSTTVENAEDAALQRALNHAGFNASLPLNSDLKASAPLPIGSLTPNTMTLTPANGGRSGPGPAQGSPPPTPQIPPTVPQAAPALAIPPPADPEPAPAYSGYSEPELPEPPAEPEDYSDILAETDVHLRRIGWGAKEGREFLEQRFGKKSRHQLNEAELREFLRHLKQQPARSARQESPF